MLRKLYKGARSPSRSDHAIGILEVGPKEAASRVSYPQLSPSKRVAPQNIKMAMRMLHILLIWKKTHYLYTYQPILYIYIYH